VGASALMRARMIQVNYESYTWIARQKISKHGRGGGKSGERSIEGLLRKLRGPRMKEASIRSMQRRSVVGGRGSEVGGRGSGDKARQLQRQLGAG
jgi:hypothetical protein